MAKPHYRWPKGLRQQIINRDQQCQIKTGGCTNQPPWHIDHITPIQNGGRWWDPNNLRLTCQNCNLARPHHKHPPNSRQW